MPTGPVKVALLLPLTMLPIVLLSKQMAILVNHGISTLSAPQALGGFLVAVSVPFALGGSAVGYGLEHGLLTVTMGAGRKHAVQPRGEAESLALSEMTGLHFVEPLLIDIPEDQAGAGLIGFGGHQADQGGQL